MKTLIKYIYTVLILTISTSLLAMAIGCSKTKREGHEILDLNLVDVESENYHYKDYDFLPAVFNGYRPHLPINSTWWLITAAYEKYISPDYTNSPKYLKIGEMYNTIIKVNVIGTEKRMIKPSENGEIIPLDFPILDNNFDLSNVKENRVPVYLVKGLKREQDKYQVSIPEYDFDRVIVNNYDSYSKGLKWYCKGEEYRLTIACNNNKTDLYISKGFKSQILLSNFDEDIISSFFTNSKYINIFDIDGDGLLDVCITLPIPSENVKTNKKYAAFILYLSSEAEPDNILKQVSARIEETSL